MKKQKNKEKIEKPLKNFKISYKKEDVQPREILTPNIEGISKIEDKRIEPTKKIKKYRHKVLKNEEVKPKKMGGGSFIASGILSVIVPSLFYIVLGDFNSFLKDCALPFSIIDIGNNAIVNCNEIRLVYVVSILCVFFGLILIILGITKKILEIKTQSER